MVKIKYITLFIVNDIHLFKILKFEIILAKATIIGKWINKKNKWIEVDPECPETKEICDSL